MSHYSSPWSSPESSFCTGPTGRKWIVYSSYIFNSSLSVHIIGETFQSMKVGRRGAMSAAFAVCDEVVSNLQSWITTHDDRHLSAARHGLRVTRNQRGDT